MNEQFVTVGSLLRLYIPAPWPPKPVGRAVFPMNEQLVTVGLLPLLYIPPP